MATDVSRAAVPAPGDGRRGLARKGRVILVLALVILPFGGPRWLNHDAPATGAGTAETFAKLCRQHGGTVASGHGTSVGGFCTVRYGGRTYEVDAVTPTGFDIDAAALNRQGCEEGARQERSAPAAHRRSFVFHRDTGVCERS
jgi:hypothetical protein